MSDFLTYTESVNLALIEVLENKKKSVCMGLGINDPKRIFNTTANLKEKFGEERIIEPPTSENALTGICFGLSLNGYSVCLIHQRFDFSLLLGTFNLGLKNQISKSMIISTAFIQKEIF